MKRNTIDLVKGEENMTVVLYWKKLNEEARIPEYQSELASGMDLYACLPDGPVEIQPCQTVIIPTGLSVAIPSGYEIQIRPRSGMSAKTAIRLPNAPGTIDADYRGEVGIILENTSTLVTYAVSHHDRVAQAVVAPIERAVNKEAFSLNETERGSGGYGSTGA